MLNSWKYYALLWHRHYTMLCPSDNVSPDGVIPGDGWSTQVTFLAHKHVTRIMSLCIAGSKRKWEFCIFFCYCLAVSESTVCDAQCVQVAETLLNPFGEDDDDFEINDLIDENLQVIGSCSAQQLLFLGYLSWSCIFVTVFQKKGKLKLCGSHVLLVSCVFRSMSMSVYTIRRWICVSLIAQHLRHYSWS